ncbi:MAG: 2TM domain-containing protein [Candidatus Helarchaeota archaeon]
MEKSENLEKKSQQIEMKPKDAIEKNTIQKPTAKLKQKRPDDMMPENWFTKLFMTDMFFILHFFVYGGVMCLCLMLNLMYFNGRMWVITAVLGWLIGLSVHFTIYQLTKKTMFTKKDGLKASWFIHLTIYLSVMLLLVWINLAVWEGFLWVPIPAFGWGIGLGAHAIIAFYEDLAA